MSTALGLDQHPATVPGHGTVLASTARELLERHHHGEWRIVLTDPDGRLQHVLLARRRPRRERPCRPRGDQRRGDHGTRRRRNRHAARTAAIVELQVPTTLLAALAPDDHGPWAGLLTELQHRLATLGVPGPPGVGGTEPHELARRRARAELVRWIRVRDRHCVAPGCRRPAHQADIDHTHDHALGGPTAHHNLGSWCPHHHRAKHRAGWRVSQPAQGRFVIRTRAGVTHVTRLKKITLPLPEPRPAGQPRPLPDDGRRAHDPDGPVDPDWHHKIAPHRSRAPRPTAPPPPSYEGPPPF